LRSAAARLAFAQGTRFGEEFGITQTRRGEPAAAKETLVRSFVEDLAQRRSQKTQRFRRESKYPSG